MGERERASERRVGAGDAVCLRKREERKPFDEDTKHSVMNHLAQTRCVGSISATSSVARAPRVQSLAGCPGEKLEPFGFPKNRCRWQLRDRNDMPCKASIQAHGKEEAPFLQAGCD